MMTEIPGELSTIESLLDQRSNFSARADVGQSLGVVPRIIREFGGNPVRYVLALSSGTADFEGLPNEDRANMAVITVIGNACFYRTDGTNPATVNEQTLVPGTILTLTGQETIRGFRFVSTAIPTCFLAVNYYD